MPTIQKPRLVWIEDLQLGDLADVPQGGYVDMEVTVSPDGKAIDVRCISSDLPEDFFKVVESALYRAQFDPGRINNTPARQMFRIRTNFGASNSEP